MRLASLFIFIVNIFFVRAVMAEESTKIHAYMYGGSGDPETRKNIFESDFVSAIKKAQQQKWQIGDIVFDGQHPSQQKTVSNAAKRNVEDFNSLSYESALQKIGAQIDAKEIKAGEQVLIILNSHGDPQKTDVPETSHSIDCGSKGKCSIDRLAETIKKLEAIGAKPAIIDLSCYSGNTLALASAKTCVVTSSHKDDVGYENFSEEFFAEIQSGKSLEQVFLKTRAKTKWGSPQISTNQSAQAQKAIEQAVGVPIFLVDEEELKKNKTSCELCCEMGLRNNKNLSELSQLGKRALANDPSIAAFTKSAKDYWQKYESIKAELSSLQTSGAKKVLNPSDGYHYSWQELAEIDKSKKNDYTIEYKQMILKQLKFKESLMQADADFKSYTENYDKFWKKITPRYTALGYQETDLEKKAANFYKNERKVYSELYSAAAPNGPNPCADFKF